MELSSTSTVVISVFVVVISALAWPVVKSVWLRPKKIERMLNAQGLSGNSYRFLIGDLKINYQMIKRATSSPMSSFSHDILPRVEPLMHHIIQKHGNNSFAWMGATPLIYATEPELIREIYARPEDFELPIFNLFQYVIKGVTSYQGDKWRKARKVVNPCFHLDSLKLMVPPFNESCAYMIVRWGKKIAETGSLELDVYPELQNLTSDAISRATFSSSYEEGSKIFQLITEQFYLFGRNIDINFIPGWRLLPTKANKRMVEIDQQLDNIIKGIVSKRIWEMEAGKEAKRGDMLDLLLESNKQCQILTTQELVEQCKVFYLGGQSTTSLLLTWTMILLSKHKTWQEKAREEVLNAFGNNTPDYGNLNKLKKVTMILHEVLRLYPPAELISKRANKDCKLGKLSLSANTLINISTVCVHRSPEIWGEDAHEFNPDRFSEGIFKATSGQMVYFPFGYGPRACIGQNFALLDAKMVIAMVLQRFSFELSASYSHAPTLDTFLRPEFGAQIILRQL